MTDITPIRVSNANCYLLRRAGRSILVDAAGPGSERKLLKKLSALGIAPQAIDLVILTHYHFDHTGTAEFLRDKHGVNIALHPLDVQRARPMTYRGLDGFVLMTATRMAGGAQQIVTPDHPLEEGLSLAGYGFEDAEIIELPGHTAGSVGILFSDGRLICGDALMHFTRPKLCMIAEDFEKAEQSIDKMRTRGTTTVYPGHGKPFELSELNK